jgi:hypothetical protein
MPLEGSKNKVIIKLPVGSSIVANNYFWLHGRNPFKENRKLKRELLRIRGKFFNQINLDKNSTNRLKFKIILTFS